MRTPILAFALLSLASAPEDGGSLCEPPPDVEPLACRNAEAGTAELGIGNKVTGFVPLEDGSDIAMILGPQGQHMITTRGRVHNLELPSGAGGSAFRVAVTAAVDDKVVAGTAGQFGPATAPGNAVEFLGMWTILIGDSIRELDGRMSVFTLTVTDGCGRDVTTTKNLRLVQ